MDVWISSTNCIAPGSKKGVANVPEKVWFHGMSLSSPGLGFLTDTINGASHPHKCGRLYGNVRFDGNNDTRSAYEEKFPKIGYLNICSQNSVFVRYSIFSRTERHEGHRDDFTCCFLARPDWTSARGIWRLD